MRRGTARFWIGTLICGLLGGTAPEIGYDMPSRPAAPPRRVYVLHSGLHMVLSKAGKNGAAERLRHELRQRGVAERDLVVLDSPYRTAGWSDVLPRESVAMFLASADPTSPTAQEAYRRLDRALRAREIAARDSIVWVGHSAGGQMGMTMAHLAHRLASYPELARQTQPYRFAAVITLGTPVVANPVPPEVPLRHYYSSADSVVRLLTNHSALVTASLRHEGRFAPCRDLGPNGRVRIFAGVRHHAWCSTPAVHDAILAEPSRAAPTGAGSLGQLLADTVEEELQVGFAD